VRGTKNKVDEDTTLTAITAFLMTRNDWVSTKEIIECVDRSNTLILQALKAGFEKGFFEREGTGRKGSGFSYCLAAEKSLVLNLNTNGATPREAAKSTMLRDDGAPRRKF
jgi:hypothetical protein